MSAERKVSEVTPLLAASLQNLRLNGESASEVGNGDSTSPILDQPVDHWLVTETESGGVQQIQGIALSKPSNPYFGDYTQTQFWFLYGPILVTYFVATFDSTLMASSHPVITSYFHSSNSASWLSTGFMLTSTAFQPLFGRISDTIGRRPLYLFALVTFIITTLWCALAQSMGSFIAARALCGLGAGGVTAMGSIMTNDLVKLEYRGTYQAYINLFFGLGSSCGAAFGGFLCDTIGWRWTFGIQILPIIIILLCGYFTVPADLGPQLAKKSDLSWYRIIKGFDLTGSFLLSLSTGALILGLNLGGNVLSWSSPIVVTSLMISFLSAVFLVRVEKKAYRPVMPLGMLFKPPRANLVFSNFFAQIGMNTVLFNAPLYFQAVKLDSASISGFRLAVPSGLLTIFAISTGMFITYTGRMKSPQVLGAVLMLVGAIALSSMWDGIPTWLATIFLIPTSAGQGFAFPATTVSVLAVSTQEDQAVMTSTLGLWRNLGTVMGVSVSSLILQNALLAYLEQYISGSEKTHIIDRVRKSVRAIGDLDSQHQKEAMLAYEAALRLTFISAIVVFVIVNLLVIPVTLPRLGRDKVATESEE